VEERPRGAQQRHQREQDAAAGPGHPQELGERVVGAFEHVADRAAVAHGDVEFGVGEVG
jgi:hypothetical protein